LKFALLVFQYATFGGIGFVSPTSNESSPPTHDLLTSSNNSPSTLNIAVLEIADGQRRGGMCQRDRSIQQTTMELDFVRFRIVRLRYRHV